MTITLPLDPTLSRLWRVGDDCGAVFDDEQDFDGITLTLELHSASEVQAVATALLDLGPTREQPPSQPDTSREAVAEMIAAAQACIAAADETARQLGDALGLSERMRQALTDAICNGNAHDAVAFLDGLYGEGDQ